MSPSAQDAFLLSTMGMRIDQVIKFVIAFMTVYVLQELTWLWWSWHYTPRVRIHTVVPKIASQSPLLRTRRENSTRALWLLAALLVTFCLTTIFGGMTITVLQGAIRIVLIESTPDTPLGLRIMRYAAWLQSIHVDLVQSWVASTADAGLLFIISDVLVAWRAIAIWPGYSAFGRTLKLALCCLIFLSFGFWLADVGIQTHRSIHPQGTNGGKFIYNTDISAILPIVSSSASTAANILATAMLNKCLKRQ
ncbi:hypothetical protein BDV98DRAFT_640852 [Pterulicium gracile]|uniref:Uncharacterized protein n=1 Tax=Pterulicium gracile TaxID=1884261 RepID=A0A5C3Q3E5_9AGAR|nr:hypothetical protein BDV98DRAFT_640852 [Pterula gracilis]